jgi:hypothetical protein
VTFRFTKPMQQKFLAALASSGSVDRACEAAKVSWQLAYRLRSRDAAFRARWADILADAFSRHVNGVALRGGAL